MALDDQYDAWPVQVRTDRGPLDARVLGVPDSRSVIDLAPDRDRPRRARRSLSPSQVDSKTNYG